MVKVPPGCRLLQTSMPSLPNSVMVVDAGPRIRKKFIPGANPWAALRLPAAIKAEPMRSKWSLVFKRRALYYSLRHDHTAHLPAQLNSAKNALAGEGE